MLLFFLNDYLFIYWNRNQKIVYMIITWGEGYKEMKARLRFCLEFWSTSVSSAASKSLRWGKSNLTKSESKLGKLRHSITVIDIIKNYGGHCCKIQAPRPPLSMLSSCHLTTRQSSNLPLTLIWPLPKLSFLVKIAYWLVGVGGFLNLTRLNHKLRDYPELDNNSIFYILNLNELCNSYKKKPLTKIYLFLEQKVFWEAVYLINDPIERLYWTWISRPLH